MPTRVAVALLLALPAAAQITITLTGQSMLRSDLRETVPAAVQNRVVFANPTSSPLIAEETPRLLRGLIESRLTRRSIGRDMEMKSA